jgi:uncharacterized protein
MFDNPTKLILGLLTGVAFGFLLQKGRVAKHDVIVNAFLLKDYTAAKVMAIAAAVGSLGVYAFVESGLGELHIKEAQLGGIITGGILFGIGIVFYGYCPGTGIAATGEGHKDAFAGLFGMLFGAGAYILTYPMIESLRKSYPNWGKMTLPSVVHTSPWPWVIGFAGLVGIISFISYYKNQGKLRYE